MLLYISRYSQNAKYLRGNVYDRKSFRVIDDFGVIAA